jgi:transposase-like protein
MEADVEGLIGAGRHERTGERLTYRNGFRDRSFDTRLGALQLRIPKLRQGTYFPPFLEPRKTGEKALVAVIQEAWIGGVSTRRVDELVQAMGCPASPSPPFPSCVRDIDERVGPSRPAARGRVAYLWLDATYLRQREGGRIVSVGRISPWPATPKGGARSSACTSAPRGGDLLGRLPQEPGEARAQGREARGLRRP